jgi:predicted nucleic acid-binding protein
MDDRTGRNAARQCGLAVVGTIGLLEQAAIRRLIELPTVLARLRQTNARLDPELIQAALARNQARRQSR